MRAGRLFPRWTAAVLVSAVCVAGAPWGGVTASAATAADCSVEGAAQFLTPLGAVPTPTNFDFQANMTCLGLVASSPALATAAQLNGAGVCSEGSIALSVCTVDYVEAFPVAAMDCAASTVYLQVGPIITDACVLNNGDVETQLLVWTPNPLVQVSVSTMTLTGVAIIAGAS